MLDSTMVRTQLPSDANAGDALSALDYGAPRWTAMDHKSPATP